MAENKTESHDKLEKRVEAETAEKAPEWFAVTIELAAFGVFGGAIWLTYYLITAFFEHWIAPSYRYAIGSIGGVVMLALINSLGSYFLRWRRKPKSVPKSPKARAAVPSGGYGALSQRRSDYHRFRHDGSVALSVVLWFANESGGAIVAAGCGCVILAHYLFTRYRVFRGEFGTNGQEASELIEFIIKYGRDTGHPPGPRLSKPVVQYEDRKLGGKAEAAGVAP